MSGLILVFAVSATVAMAAVAVTACAYAVAAVDGCYWKMRARRAGLDPALARPISPELRQAIAEREASRG